MKRFFMYCIVVIGALFVGLAFYMFAKNNEVIECSIPQGETIYLNVGDSLSIPITHTKKNKRTTIETKSDNSSAAEINAESGKIEAKSGGTAIITIAPSNENYGPFSFTVKVGDGSNNNPYFISNVEQLRMIGTTKNTIWTLNDCYEVVSNIDLKGQTWKPISKFAGVFNGGTKTISNLVIDDTCESNYVGLFGEVASGAKIEKVTLVDPQIKVSGKHVGAIAGLSEGVITRCHVVGGNISSSSEESFVGGIVGTSKRDNSENEISMCHVDGTTLNAANVVGGVAGQLYAGVVANCKVNADIATDQETQAKFAAGLIGHVSTQTVTVTTVDGAGKETTQGYEYNSLIQTNLVIPEFGKDGETYFCETKSVLIAQDSTASAEYVGNFFCSDEIEESKAQKLDTTAAEEKNNFTYMTKNSNEVSWDFTGTWYLEGKSETDSIGPCIVQDGVGQVVRPVRNGTPLTKNNIATILTKLMSEEEDDRKYRNYIYVISEEISVDVSTSFNNGWTPIGNVANPFLGTIRGTDENAKLILKNVTIPSSNIKEYQSADNVVAKTAGIFGYVGSVANISNIVVENMKIESASDTDSGAFVGQNYGVMSNCSVSGLTIENGKHVGGIAGINGGRIANCSIDAFTTAEGTLVLGKIEAEGGSSDPKWIGGIAGDNSGKLLNCTSKVSVSGKNAFIGGIAGWNSGIIKDCARTGENISSSEYTRLGGLVGVNAITNDSQEFSIENCYSSMSDIFAATDSKDSYVGGLVGENFNGKITKSYFSGKITGYRVGGLAGQVTGGKVTQCYASANLKGPGLGGMAYSCSGNIEDCYFAGGTIEFPNDPSGCEYAGLTVKLQKGAYIAHCYVSTTSGLPSDSLTKSTGVHLDIANTYRSEIASWVTGRSKNRGEINNNVVNSKGIKIGFWDRWVEKTALAATTWTKDGWKFRTQEISGDSPITDPQKDYFISCGFNTEIWNFEGNTPQLSALPEEGGANEFEGNVTYELEGEYENVSLGEDVLEINGFSEGTTIEIVLKVEIDNGSKISNVTKYGECVDVKFSADDQKVTITAKEIGEATIEIAFDDYFTCKSISIKIAE